MPFAVVRVVLLERFESSLLFTDSYCQSSALLSVLTVLANSTFEGMFYFLKPQRWSIFPTEKEKYAVLAVSLPTF